jgi:hypothetical protein
MRELLDDAALQTRLLGLSMTEHSA